MPSHNVQAQLRMVSEQAFQDAVIQVARLRGWRVYHTHDSRHSAAGFPDLAMVREREGHPTEFMMAELKTERGELSPEQAEWMRLLNDAGIRCYLWRPSSAWPQLLE